jgi:hypothetical protein
MGAMAIKNWQLGAVESKADTSRFDLNEATAVGTTWIRGRQQGIKARILVMARIIYFYNIRFAPGDPPVQRMRTAFLP